MEYIQPKSSLTKNQLAEMAARFQNLKNRPDDLAALLNLSPTALEKLVANPKYFTFQIPKPGGQKRLIHAPEPLLKGAQSRLNQFLQACYYFVKPTTAHGFILCPADDSAPRNAYTNALVHATSQIFWNLDLKDFFHTVNSRHLLSLFKYRFEFPDKLIQKLLRLTTFQNVLPMGAPTSPALSNFVFWHTDRDLLELARREGGRYSRYADDLTFSFPKTPDESVFEIIRQRIGQNGFVLNEQKIRKQTRLDQPEITGLVIAVAQKPTVSSAFLKKLKKEIRIYRWLVSETVRTRQLFPSWIFEQMRRSVGGQLEFAGMVLGKTDRVFKKLASEFHFG